MKTLILTAAVLFSFAANAEPIFCQSRDGNDFPISMTADWSTQSLTNIALKADTDTEKYASATWNSYSAKNAKYKGMDRYQLSGDGWSTTSILLPRAVKGDSFIAYYYDVGESGSGVYAMDCSIQ